MSNKLAVSDLVNYLKKKNDSDSNLLNLCVSGELSNVKIYPSNHLYFDLKDDRAKISCVMFSSMSTSLNFTPKSGDKVFVKGSIKVYVNNANFQIVVSNIQKDGLGDVYLEFEKNKAELEKLGYFDAKHKKIIPKFPSKVAVIAGHNSAALKDILRTLNSRYKIANIVVFTCLVQGKQAAKALIETIDIVNKYQFDSIILARGGGSFEDLSAFNDLNLAKTIFNSTIPIVTGIGHESDFTIADFVSDYRAATPTAAAIKVVPEKFEILKQLEKQNMYFNNFIKYRINTMYQSVDSYYSRINNYFFAQLNSKKLELSNLSHTLEKNNINLRIQKQNQNIMSNHLKLNNLYQYYIEKNKAIILEYFKQLDNVFKQQVLVKKNSINEKIITLNLLDPNNITSKGYAIVYKNNNIIKNSSEIYKDDEIKVVSKNFKFKAIISEVIEDGN